MMRLVARFSLAVLISFLLSIVFGVLVFYTNAKMALVANPPPAATGLMALASDRLSALSVADLEAQRETLESMVGTSIRIVGDTGEVPPAARDRLARHGGAVFFVDSDLAMVVPAGEGRWAILGPNQRLAPPFDLETLLVLLATFLVIIVVVGTLMATPVVQRLQRFQAIAVAITSGELGARVDDDSADPLGDLARRFNVMADRNQALINSQRDLRQAVAHELRTPTARVRFGLEMLRQAGDAEAREERVNSIDEDLTEIDGLVEELLVYNRVEADGTLDREKVDACRVLRDVSDYLRPLRPDLEVEIDDPSGCVVIAHPPSFTRAMRNLMSNAFKYAAGRVRVGCRSTARGAEIAVADDGPGIPAGDRARVLEPFARSDASRDRASGGVGLGLAIVDRIVAAHGGTLRIEEADIGGACVVTEWRR